MRVTHLVWREIFHRRLSFALGLIAVAVATMLVVGGLTLLAAQRDLMNELVGKQKDVVAARGEDLEDAMRRITKRMGFNVVILPRGQNLDDPFSDDYASKFMPEEYADRLANSTIVTVNHLLPTLEQRVDWPERNGRTFFLVGVKGQVPIAHRDPRKPIMQPVPENGMVIGNVLATEENIAEGDQVTFMGHSLEVQKVNPRVGDKRDMTAWVDLKLTQKLFDREGQINAIWALECDCALADVGRIRAELGEILPDVDIQEQGGKALARAEARQKAVDTAQQALKDEEANGKRLDDLATNFRNFFMPIIILSSGVWLGLLTVGNVRERRYEIGLFHALGVGPSRILLLFLSRAGIIGLVGAALGFAGGSVLGFLAFSVLAEEQLLEGQGLASPSWQFDPSFFFWVLALATILSAIACWLPAIAATKQDPAIVLREE